MKKTTLVLAAALAGGLALGAGSASATPIGFGGLQTSQPEVVQVAMTRSERMMMRKRMMRRQMMHRRMMHRRMMRRM